MIEYHSGTPFQASPTHKATGRVFFCDRPIVCKDTFKVKFIC